MREVDQLMINEYGISLIQMMENAGRHLAELTFRYMKFISEFPKITVIVGAGNNGGGGMVAARHFSNRGFNVTTILLSNESHLKPVPKKQWRILQNLPVKLINQPSVLRLKEIISNSDVIIDAIIGYGIIGYLRDITKEYIQIINNNSSIIVISLDAPTGFRFDKKNELASVVKATATLSLALPKVGMDDPKNKAILGDLYLGDISVPPTLYDQMGFGLVSPFISKPIIRIH